jgi:ABC-type polysaccharide/polyol phosphate transport system ATPase subunit
MYSNEVAIRVRDLGKCYEIYSTPRDRLKQFLLPQLRNIFNIPQKPYFREFWALKHASFEVKKGETVGIIGKNGSGKSTLLQMVCGTLYPTMGAIEIFGRVAALLELGSGFNPEFTGRENVYLNASVLGLATTEIDSHFSAIADFADIGEFMEQPVKTYSSGMFVRLAFSVAVHVQPDILIVDEALSVGDIAFQNRCLQRIQALKRQGTSILFVSHDLSTVQIICDHVIWLKNGGIHQYGEAGLVCQNYYADTLGAGNTLAVRDSREIPQQSTGMACFSKLVTLDDTGRESSTFDVGKSLCVQFQLLALSNLDECVFTISIYRADGDWSIGQTSADKNTIWPPVAAGGKLTGKLFLEPLCLTPADYRICLSAFSRDLHTCYAMTEVTALFSIRSPYQTWGKFIHPCEWIREV